MIKGIIHSFDSRVLIPRSWYFDTHQVTFAGAVIGWAFVCLRRSPRFSGRSANMLPNPLLLIFCDLYLV